MLIKQFLSISSLCLLFDSCLKKKEATRQNRTATESLTARPPLPYIVALPGFPSPSVPLRTNRGSCRLNRTRAFNTGIAISCLFPSAINHSHCGENMKVVPAYRIPPPCAILRSMRICCNYHHISNYLSKGGLAKESNLAIYYQNWKPRYRCDHQSAHCYCSNSLSDSKILKWRPIYAIRKFEPTHDRFFLQR